MIDFVETLHCDDTEEYFEGKCPAQDAGIHAGNQDMWHFTVSSPTAFLCDSDTYRHFKSKFAQKHACNPRDIEGKGNFKMM